MSFKKLLLPLVAAVAGAISTAQAFPDKNIEIVIPYGPGGGFDTAVRAFAPHFADALGQGVVVVPQNVPGAGGRRGSTTVYRAQPDGHTVGIFNLPGFALPSILGERVDYDLRKISWIGRLESQDYALLVPAKSDIKSIEDLRKKKDVTLLSTGYGSSVLAGTQIVAQVLGLQKNNPVYLTGYTGTSDYLVGLVRGDGDAALAPVGSSAKYVKAGDLRAIAVSGKTSGIEGVPTFAELGYQELTPLNVQRIIGAPPGVDPAVLKQLREAFAKAVNNPEFKKAAAKANMDLAPLVGEEAAAAVEESFGFYEKFRANLENPSKF